MIDHCLTDDEIEAVAMAARGVAGLRRPAADPDLLKAVAVAVGELPVPLRAKLTAFRLDGVDGVVLIRGWPVDDDGVGPTPSHWSEVSAAQPVSLDEAALLLFASLVGDPFGWAGQQAGKLVQEVIPTLLDRHAQVGSSSDVTLNWHSEDAFHEHRPEYLALFCIRNPDHVGTTLADLTDIVVAPDDRDLLFEPVFAIRSDDAYARTPVPDGALARVATLFGNPDRPYLRVDPSYTELPRSRAHQEAYQRLCDAISDAARVVTLQPGDCLVIDNYRVVHGRLPFRARFDGTDRWLKRVCISRSLHLSSHLRSAVNPRVLH